jgi:hypothetical protein
LSANEAEVRRVAYALKVAEPQAVKFAAEHMAPLVPHGALLVPVPSHDGSLEANTALAQAVAARVPGVTVEPLIERAQADPSNTHRRHMGDGSIHASVHHFTARGEVPADRDVLLIDNVTTSGATFRAAAMVLGTGRGLAFARANDVRLPPYRGVATLQGAADVGFPPVSLGADWDESQHPRDERGKFTESGGGGGTESVREQGGRYSVQEHESVQMARDSSSSRKIGRASTTNSSSSADKTARKRKPRSAS